MRTRRDTRASRTPPRRKHPPEDHQEKQKINTIYYSRIRV